MVLKFKSDRVSSLYYYFDISQDYKISFGIAHIFSHAFSDKDKFWITFSGATIIYSRFHTCPWRNAPAFCAGMRLLGHCISSFGHFSWFVSFSFFAV